MQLGAQKRRRRGAAVGFVTDVSVERQAVRETLARSRGRQRLETSDNLPKLCKSFFATLVADDPSLLLQRHYYAAEAAWRA